MDKAMIPRSVVDWKGMVYLNGADNFSGWLIET